MQLSQQCQRTLLGLLLASLTVFALITFWTNSANAAVRTDHFCWGQSLTAKDNHTTTDQCYAVFFGIIEAEAWSPQHSVCLEYQLAHEQKCSAGPGAHVYLKVQHEVCVECADIVRIENNAESPSTVYGNVEWDKYEAGGTEPPPPPVRGDLNGDRVPDLYAIALSHTGGHKTGIHVLSGKSQYQEWLTQRETPLAETSPQEWQWAVGDVNRDGKPDLIGVDMNHTGGGHTGVHVLSGSNEYQEWLVQRETPLGETSPTQWQWLAADMNADGIPDLVGVQMNGTGEHHTGIHILNGADQYQEWLIQRETPLQETSPAEWEWTVGDVNGDGIQDLVGIQLKNTSDHMTDIVAYSGADQFQTQLIHRATPFGETNPSDWQWIMTDENQDGIDDLVSVQTEGNAGHHTAVRVLNGGTQYTSSLTQREAVLGEVNLGQWEFAAAP